MAPLFTRSALGLSLLASLASGSCIIQTPGFDAASFVDWLDTLRPTCYSASATVQMAVIDALERRAPRMPHSLRFARASSMTLPAAVQAKLESLLGVPVIQACGSTETGTVAQNPLPPGVRKPGSIGVSVGLEIRIADPDGNALPTGEIGEMLLRGPGVMSGYEQDPEANRRAFHGSWYRSGDLAYVDADGYVFITGRVRELINRGGIKVSPGEVDRKFMEHPEVREAATFSIPHPTLGEDVITAIALRERSAVTPAHLRQFALENLAPSKAPSQVVLVDALPRTALGKVRRNALGHLLRESLSASYVRPRDDDELLIAALFAEILARSPIGADDHFFLLGGDSLTAARLIARLEARCGVVLAPLAVFEAPTVAQLAARLRAAPRAAALPAIPKLVRHRRA
jgi:acyl-CoA synthetase (AMP-forming)/AMP-acid ligase II/acyl carrier protein